MMKLDFDLAARDLMGSVFPRSLIRRFALFGVLMAVVLLAVDAYFALTRHLPLDRFIHHALTQTIWTLAIGWILFIVLMLGMIPIRCRRAVRNDTRRYQGISVELDDEGVVARNRNSISKWAWSELAGYKENRRVFLLCPHKTYGVLVPKRVLVGAQAAEFERLVRGKLKRLPA